MKRILCLLCTALSGWLILAAERPVPPAGVAVSDADRAELQAGLRRLQAAIDSLRAKHGPRSLLLADVRIFYDAARYGLQHNEFLKPEEIQRAKDFLRQGQERADYLAEGRAPWALQSGLWFAGMFRESTTASSRMDW